MLWWPLHSFQFSPIWIFPNVLFALIAGLVFGFLYAKTKNLWLTILIHALNNGYAVFSSHADFFETGEAWCWKSFSGHCVLGLVALVLLLTVKRKELFSGNQESYSMDSLRAGECVSCIVRSTMFWCFSVSRQSIRRHCSFSSMEKLAFYQKRSGCFVHWSWREKQLRRERFL